GSRRRGRRPAAARRARAADARLLLTSSADGLRSGEFPLPGDRAPPDSAGRTRGASQLPGRASARLFWTGRDRRCRWISLAPPQVIFSVGEFLCVGLG